MRGDSSVSQGKETIVCLSSLGGRIPSQGEAGGGAGGISETRDDEEPVSREICEEVSDSAL